MGVFQSCPFRDVPHYSKKDKPTLNIEHPKTVLKMKAVTLFAVLVSLSIILDLTNSIWFARSRAGSRPGGRFSRFGRSDPDMIDNDENDQGADYDDNDILDALADIIVDRQEKRSVSSLIRNRDMRSLSALYGKRGMMNPMAKAKGLGK